jgi:hypothetical protein
MNLRESVRRYGILHTAHLLTYKVAKRLVHYLSMKCVWIAVPAMTQRALINSAGYTIRFLEPRELVEFSSQREYEIPGDFLQSAILRGDDCVGVLDGNTLISYGWYSRCPTAVNDDLVLHFDPAYVYMYKGFTHPKYRGRHLSDLVMAFALQEYANRGNKGLVSFAESHNWPSLKALYGMGCKDLGTIHSIRLFGKYFVSHSRSCEQFQCRLVPVAGERNAVLPMKSASGSRL